MAAPRLGMARNGRKAPAGAAPCPAPAGTLLRRGARGCLVPLVRPPGLRRAPAAREGRSAELGTGIPTQLRLAEEVFLCVSDYPYLAGAGTGREAAAGIPAPGGAAVGHPHSPPRTPAGPKRSRGPKHARCPGRGLVGERVPHFPPPSASVPGGGGSR